MTSPPAPTLNARTRAALDRGFAVSTWWPGWAQLPRETRDVLFLLGVIAWTLAPHASHLPAWCIFMTAAVLLWRARLALLQLPLPGRWSVLGVLAVALALTAWSHGSLIGRDPGVTMLVVLMVLKTLELRARRDALVVFFLGFFLVLTHFLYSQSIAVAAAMLIAVWGLLTALVLAHMPVGRPWLRHAMALAARTALLGLPVMLVLFLLFPRIGPLWGLPQDAGAARTGLSGTLTMGGMAELAGDDRIALRVRFEGPPPPPELLYWRGPVLGRFDGRDWHRVEAGAPAAVRLRTHGAGLDYEIVVEPSTLTALPLLEATPATGALAPRPDGLRIGLTPDLQWLAERPLAERVQLRARAYPRFDHGPLAAGPELDDYLRLPAGFNPRTLAWAQALQQAHGAGATTLALVQDVLAHIRREPYVYTLTPGTYGDERGRHAVDEFWLDRRAGFCEHYAVAFTVIMRALGVPARIVTGYQGADAVLQDGWVVVRNSHAHAWTEVWVEGRGWLRVDPTAAVAPERILSSLALRPAPGLVAGAIAGVNPELLDSLRRAWETLNHQWNHWVLSYSRGHQLDLLRALGFSAPDWADLGVLLLALLSTAAAATAGWVAWDRWRQDPWLRLHQRLRAALASLGVAAAAHEAPRTLAARVEAELGARGQALAQALRELDRARYGVGPALRPRAWSRRFERIAGALRRGAAGAARPG
jgi:transglutaminase-like putative cysteine protease